MRIILITFFLLVSCGHPTSSKKEVSKNSSRNSKLRAPASIPTMGDDPFIEEFLEEVENAPSGKY